MPRRFVLGVLGVMCACVLAACGPSAAQVAAQQKAECFNHESQILTAINLVHADTGVYPDIASVLKQLPSAKCPSGGTYTFDPNTDTVTCSVHGKPADQKPAIP